MTLRAGDQVEYLEDCKAVLARVEIFTIVDVVGGGPELCFYVFGGRERSVRATDSVAVQTKQTGPAERLALL